ncbi:hypothetical protein HMPREF1986_01294 [Oribacterium sp. oral taxon 078 str. F0263]|mgnify:FL=1|nr:hypothetical protein [Oribacterium sp. oral taxon 078]ERL21527.1 hypothetical protein HMPREF1986_01294 [Oribacterium sp. oral taxon 078 str. F0263]
MIGALDRSAFLREKAPGGGERKEKEARRTGVLICGAFAGKADER